jgi:nitrogen fixation NifU-like protein
VLGVGATARASFYLYNDTPTSTRWPMRSTAQAISSRSEEAHMPGFEDLYREIILDHYRNPRNRGELPPPAPHARGHNPLCGDEIDVYLDVDDGVVTDVKVGGQGCSISQSSADDEPGRQGQAGRGSARARAPLQGDDEHPDEDGNPIEPDPAVKLGDLEALQGVVKFPVRIKCATLSWNTLLEALVTGRRLTRSAGMAFEPRAEVFDDIVPHPDGVDPTTS